MRLRKITLDTIPFEFGKYAGMTASEIATKDIDYILFAYYTYKDAPVSQTLVRYCEMIKFKGYDYE
jgi:hypothetical protein